MKPKKIELTSKSLSRTAAHPHRRPTDIGKNISSGFIQNGRDEMKIQLTDVKERPIRGCGPWIG